MEVTQALQALRQHRRTTSYREPSPATPEVVIPKDAPWLPVLWNKSALQKKWFAMLRVATVGMVWADDHYRQKRLGVAMRLWQRKARLRRRTKKGFRQRKMRLKKNCFRAWKIFTQREERLRRLRGRALLRRNNSLVERSFRLWTAFAAKRVVKKQKMEDAKSAYRRTRTLRALALLSRNARRCKELKEHRLKADKCFASKHLSPCFQTWQRYMLQRRWKVASRERADMCYKVSVARRSLRRLHQHTAESRRRTLLEGYVRKMRIKQRQRTCLLLWRSRLEKQKLIRTADLCFLRKCWGNMVICCKLSLKRRCEEALGHRRQHELRKGFLGLAVFAAQQRHERNLLLGVVMKQTLKSAFWLLRRNLQKREEFIQRLIAFEQQRKTNLLLLRFQQLAANTLRRRRKMVQLRAAEKAHAKSSKAYCLAKLLSHVKHERVAKHLDDKADRFLRLGALQKLCNACARQGHVNRRFQIAKRFRKRHRKQTGWLSLRSYALRHRETRMHLCHASGHFSTRLRARFFLLWRENAAAAKTERVALLFYSRSTLRWTFSRWQNAAIALRADRRLDDRARAHFREKYASSTLQTLWLLAAQCKASRAAIRFSRSRAKRRALRKLQHYQKHQKLSVEVARKADKFLVRRRKACALAAISRHYYQVKFKRLRTLQQQKAVAISQKRLWIRKWWAVRASRKHHRKHQSNFRAQFWQNWRQLVENSRQIRKADAHFHRSATLRAFSYMNLAVHRSHARRLIENEVRARHKRSVRKRVLQEWLRCKAEAGVMKVAASYRCRRITAKAFLQWKEECVKNRLALEYYRLHLVRVVDMCFQRWRDHVVEGVVEEAHEALAELQWRQGVLRKFFGLWMLSAAEDKREVAALAYRNSMLLKRCMERWKTAEMEAKAHALEQMLADVFWRKKLLQKCFDRLAMGGQMEEKWDPMVDVLVP